MTNPLDAPSSVIIQSPRERYEAIVAHAAHRWGVTTRQIKGRSRKWPIVDARWECCEALTALGLSSVKVGRLLNLDSSSVLYALKVSRQRRDDAK